MPSSAHSTRERLARLKRIPARCRRDVAFFRLLENWRAALVAEWQCMPLPEIRARNGVILSAPHEVDLGFLFDEIWIHHVYTPRHYEIGAGDVVIDVGANIGVFAAFAATRAPDVSIFAYEPFPPNVAWLRRNIADSRLANVAVRQQAVAARTEPRQLRVDAGRWVRHSLHDLTSEVQATVSIEGIGLDDVMGRENIERCDLLKLDCEGSEYEILNGCAPETLRRLRRIVSEYHEGPGISGTGAELCRFLETRSFRIDHFDRHAGTGMVCATNTRAYPPAPREQFK